MISAIAHLGLLDDEDIALDIAALDLSVLDHDGIDLAPYRALFDDFEADLRGAGGDRVESAAEQAGLLATILAERHGLSGDAATYDAPLNADMIRVLDRRRGLPVSLSIIYVAMARRLGWVADALNTPGHVLVRIGPVDDFVIIDPFRNGVPVSADTVLNLVRDVLGPDAPLDQSYVAPMSNRMVLVRLLLNQATRAEDGGDPARALAVYERMVEIAPGNGASWWALARLQLAAGKVEDARISLSSMLEVTRHADSRAHIVAALEALQGR